MIPDDPVKPSNSLQSRIDDAGVDFLYAEVATCQTFCDLARTRLAIGDQFLAGQAIAHAEKGYSTLVRYLSDAKHIARLGQANVQRLSERAAQLRAEIDGLMGENSGTDDR